MRELICFSFAVLLCCSVACPSFQLVFRSVSLFPRPHTEICLVMFLTLSPFPVVGATREVES